MLREGMGILSGTGARLGVVTHKLRHQHPKGRPSGLRFTFDDAAMIANDLGGEREPQTGPGRFGGYERVEQVRHEVLGHTWSVVPHAEFERKRYARLAAGQ